MQSRKNRWQEDVFVASPLRDLVPEDHILKRVDAILDVCRDLSSISLYSVEYSPSIILRPKSMVPTERLSLTVRFTPTLPRQDEKREQAEDNNRLRRAQRQPT